jgi:hypothetical protein
MQNTVRASRAVEVMDKVVFRWRKPMKARYVAGGRERVVCFPG